MGARQKLNEAAFLGCAVVAGVVEAAAQSWAVFLVALAVAVGAALANRTIRPAPARR